MGKFEVALLSDVIEHFPKEKGFQLIKQLFDHVDDIIISTSLGFCPKTSQSVKINPYENHISGWTREDFKEFTIIEYVEIPRINKSEKILVMYLRK